jgi:transposase-like protein
MKQKRHTTEEIIRILRQAEGGKNVEAVCREHNVTATSDRVPEVGPERV